MHRTLKNAAARLLPKSQFVRNVGVLAGGTASSQLLIIIAAPFLTRLFTPEDFGILGVYSGLLTLFAVVASLRYELAILIPEDDDDAINLVFLCLFIVIFTVLMSSLFVYFLGDIITEKLNVPRLEAYLWLLPVGVLFLGSYKVLNHWALRKKNFKIIARTKIKQSIATLVLQVGGYAAGPVALISGQAIGQGIGSFNLADADLRSRLYKKRQLIDVLHLAKRYRAFPLYSSWASLFDTIGSQASVLMIVAYFSPTVAGLYILAFKVLTLPTMVAGTAIGNVFLSHITTASQQGRLGSITNKIHNNLAHIALPPLFSLVLVAPMLFELIFGKEWRQAGEFAQWMAPWIYVLFITLPLSTLFEVMEKQSYNLAFRSVLCITKITTILLGAFLNSIEVMIIAYSLGNASCWLVYLLWINKSVGNKTATMFFTTLSALLWGLACNLPLLMAMSLNDSNKHIILSLPIVGIIIMLRCGFMFKRLL